MQTDLQTHRHSHVLCYTASVCKAFWEFWPFGELDDHFPSIPPNLTLHGSVHNRGLGPSGRGGGGWDIDRQTERHNLIERDKNRQIYR